MKISSEAMEAIAELKGHTFDLADSDQAYVYDEVVRELGEYVGRVCGKDMKKLLVSNVALTLTKPIYPTGTDNIEEKKAVWSKEYDQWMKESKRYEELKGRQLRN